MGVLVIPEGKTVLFRAAIFIGLGTVVTTIIYLTPIPDQYPQSCSRPCHELDWPMICRVKLTLEKYQTLGNHCKHCLSNKTECYHEKCITVDGQVKGILAANRQFPGPTLQVCQNDIVVVDIVNRIPGQSFGVHWRGQPQLETPYMDGVPMITQCPIPSLTTYQYKFRASESGTHIWQVNTGEEILETLFGPLIVRKPDVRETHRKLYDTDDVENVVVIHPWNPDKSSLLFPDGESKTKLLINGKTQNKGVPAASFKVTPGRRHRFRVIYAGGAENCKIRLSIDKHQLLVIALDGHSIKPKMVASVRLFPGERLDFVLRADQVSGFYHMKAEPMKSCKSLVQTFAIIQYDETHDFGNSYTSKVPVEITEFKEMGMIFGDECSSNGAKICLHDIHATKSLPKELSKMKPDAKFYFFHDSVAVTGRNIFNTSFVALLEKMRISQTNNISMMLPSSPLLSQLPEIDSDIICNNESIPKRCKDNVEGICECVHVVDIPLNAVVELVLVNQEKEDHVFHLHGHSFHVVGATHLPLPRNPEKIKQLDEKDKLVKRNFNFPMIKDTVAVPNNSVVVVRFKADNPGYWLLDEEHASHWSRGMSVVLHVGKKSDLVAIPQNFPKCGDWVGPEFFLV